MAVKKVHYVSMQFPAPAMGGEVRVLRRSNIDLSMSLLHKRPKNWENKLAAADHTPFPCHHLTNLAFLKGTFLTLRHPLLFLQMLLWTIGHSWNKPTHLAKSLYFIPVSFSIWRRIKTIKPDVVHLFWGHYPSLVGYLVHKTLPQIVLSHFLGAYDLVMKYGPSKDVSQWADCVWTHAFANVDDIVKMGAPIDKVSVSHRGVDLRRMDTFNIKEKKIPKRISAIAGRLIPSKRTDKAIKIFAKILKKEPDATLFVLGDGIDMSNLKALVENLKIEKSVFFTGRLSQKELFKELAKSEAFILMSEHPSERLPNSVKEAMYFGNICLTTDTPGIDELITDGLDGIIVKSSQIQKGAKTLLDLMSDSKKKEDMADAAKKKILSSFDADKLIKENYTASWNKAMEEKAGT
ncbi:MAG: glycosyltransferase [Alphaproteobacteria bacterium]